MKCSGPYEVMRHAYRASKQKLNHHISVQPMLKLLNSTQISKEYKNINEKYIKNKQTVNNTRKLYHTLKKNLYGYI
jgi:hypothetical protein